MSIPVIPECPGAEVAARRDQGVSLSPLPWRLDEREGAIYDAAGAYVCMLGNAWGDVSETDLRNGRAIVAAANVLGQRADTGA